MAVLHVALWGVKCSRRLVLILTVSKGQRRCDGKVLCCLLFLFHPLLFERQLPVSMGAASLRETCHSLLLGYRRLFSGWWHLIQKWGSLLWGAPDGCGEMTFRTILFLIENRASSLGKKRTWRSEWTSSVCCHLPDAALVSWSVKIGSTSSCLKGRLVLKRNFKTLRNKEFSPKENIVN